MRIAQNGDVHVSVPYGVPKMVVEAFIENHREWMERAQQATVARQQRRAGFFAQLPLQTKTQRADAIRRLSAIVEPMVEQYAATIGVSPTRIHYKRMISRWGVCNVREKSICFSLYLLLLPQLCIEHTVVHELCHLIEPHHNARFHALVDCHFPRRKEAEKLSREIYR